MNLENDEVILKKIILFSDNDYVRFLLSKINDIESPFLGVHDIENKEYLKKETLYDISDTISSFGSYDGMGLHVDLNMIINKKDTVFTVFKKIKNDFPELFI